MAHMQHKKRKPEKSLVDDPSTDETLQTPLKLRSGAARTNKFEASACDTEKDIHEDPYGDDFDSEDNDSDGESVGGNKEDALESQSSNNEVPPVLTEVIEPFLPGIHSLAEGEELERDPKAYRMFHQLALDFSCLSIDIIPDELGAERAEFPHTMYLAGGTQPEKPADGRLYCMKLTNLTGKVPKPMEDESDVSDESDDDEDDEDNAGTKQSANFLSGQPMLHFAPINQMGDTNRVRVCPQLPRLIATWNSSKQVTIWDTEEHRTVLEKPGTNATANIQPKFRYAGHRGEGFGLGWSFASTGVFASGGHDGTIRVFQPSQGGWSDTPVVIRFHKESVEDIHWKPIGGSDVFAAASVDKSITIWDSKVSPKKPQIHLANAHKADVNSVCWSPFEEDFLLSGGDDGATRVWDVRNTHEPIVHLQYHKGPVSCVDWHPTDSAMFACSSLDNTLSIWDMSVEPEFTGAAQPSRAVQQVPDQLMFLHMGQTHISEIRWHPQIPGVILSTAEDSIDVFQPCNI